MYKTKKVNGGTKLFLNEYILPPKTWAFLSPKS